MNSFQFSRRKLLKSAVATTAFGVSAGARVSSTRAQRVSLPSRKNDSLQIGCIGLRYQGSVIADKARAHGNIVALCDVDSNVLDQARASFGSTPRIYEDYRELLARSDVDVVTIGTPDHWHAKMLIDACRAGKDVYCEKPLTLTIDEGKLIRKVVRETGRVVQVGSWQRSDHNFRLAAELVRQGRIGKLKSVDIVLNKNAVGGPFAVTLPPPNLNWDMWQGQTPDTPYVYQRTHYTFRWWYEYSGGQMTDWGAHHVDIAQWAINEYPVEIESRAKLPKVKNGYNVAGDFTVNYKFPSGIVMTIRDTGRNGILFTGDEGRLFVNRGGISGKAVDELANKPFPRDAFQLYDFDNHVRPPRSGKLDALLNHMGNFFDCVTARKSPISDVASQHRSITTCHLGNISMWLGRPLKWDPHTEMFINDREANSRLKREQREKYKVV
jgi:myo-inositol 2-dehydrogenase/D-chiro-inositol 1-dehydrogenase